MKMKGLEDFDPAEFEKELAASNGDLSSSSSTDSSDESSSTDRSLFSQAVLIF